ncbi:MAG: helix-turn-helix domain-containing protein, partial [Bacteroidota bacterium]
ERLEKMMRTGKLFRDPGLNRELVADRLGISTGYLSQVVSNCTDHNFSEYINAYRVAEVKDLLENPDFSQYSLLAIGLEAGFNAKSTYFSVFKKIAGMTPSEYKKSLG